MTAPVTIFDNPEKLGWQLAGEILDRARIALRKRRRFLLGCPGGRSLRPTYQALARRAAEANDNLSHLFIVMMDEYLLSDGKGGFVNCPINAHFSCLGFAFREIVGPLNAELPADHCVPDNQVWVPDPADPELYDRYLAESGGIDLFLLASGASDGHVAFNSPGTDLATETRIVELAEETRRDNLATFPQFKDLAEVPSHGVSVGVGTIARLAREAVLVVAGAHKRAAARRLQGVAVYDPAWPSTVIHECRNGRLYLDKESAADERR
ncbi:MAG: 6-phosphogluconolactonase [Dongiaceae bacterium]